MPWFVVDDSAHSHPKFLKAGNAAVGLWMRCGSYAAQHLTDGIVPGAIAAMYGTPPQITKLIRVGLWHRCGHECQGCSQPGAGDYVMHDYAPPNPTRQEVLVRRARAAAKKRAQRDRADAAENFTLESDPNRDGIAPDSQGKTGSIHRPVFDEPPDHSSASPGDSLGTRARASHSTPLLKTHGAQRELVERSSQRSPEAPSLIPADWQPSSDDIRTAQAARTSSGQPTLTGQQLGDLLRKFIRRQTADHRQLPAAAWGLRWQEWAERERPTEPTGQTSLLVGLDGGKAPLWPHEETQQRPTAPQTPMQSCEGCQRGYRSTTPGLCRDCRATDRHTDTA